MKWSVTICLGCQSSFASSDPSNHVGRVIFLPPFAPSFLTRDLLIQILVSTVDLLVQELQTGFLESIRWAGINGVGKPSIVSSELILKMMRQFLLRWLMCYGKSGNTFTRKERMIKSVSENENKFLIK